MLDIIPIYEDENFYMLSTSFLVHSEPNYWDSLEIEPLAGFHDFVIHSDGYQFSDSSDPDIAQIYTARQVANNIRETASWNGYTPIRLIACSSGKYDDGAAAMLAAELGTEICAPICDLIIFIQLPPGRARWIVRNLPGLREVRTLSTADGANDALAGRLDG